MIIPLLIFSDCKFSLKMTNVYSRNVANNCFPILTKWLSKIIIKISDTETIHAYRSLERNSIKLIKTSSHRNFNETCLNNILFIILLNKYYRLSG